MNDHEQDRLEQAPLVAEIIGAILFAAVFGYALLGAAGCSSEAAEPRSPFVRLFSDDGRACSGVAISASEVATSAHCVAGGIDRVEGTRTANVRVHATADLALVRVDGATFESVELAPYDPDDGAELTLLGYGCSGSLVARCLRFLGDNTIGGALRADGTSCPGDSGGAWLDERGQLVAINSGEIQGGGAYGASAAQLAEIAP